MSHHSTEPAGATATAACARCGAADAELRPDRLLDAAYCVACHRRNHLDHSRLVELFVPARIAPVFDDAARAEIVGPAEALLSAQDDDVAWRELQVVRLNAFHALAKQTGEQLARGGDLRLRSPWRTLVSVVDAARGAEMDQVRSALSLACQDVQAAELHMETLTALELLHAQLRRAEPAIAR